MLLTFNNLAFAEDDDAYVKRCKVEYTQLYLITGKEIIYKNTSQFRFYNHCKEGLKRLSKKLYKWVDRKNTNIITKLNELKCKIKDVDDYWTFDWGNIWKNEYKDWGKYKDCETYTQKLSAYLVDKYPKQIGAKVYQNSIAD
jgi:hypothetical protein